MDVTFGITEEDFNEARAIAPTLSDDRERDGGFRLWLMAVQPMCFDCGVAEGTEYAHLTRSKGRRAIALGAMACRRCNLIHEAVSKRLGLNGSLPWAYVASRGRKDRIVNVMPSRGECVRIWREAKAAERDAWERDVAEAMADCLA